MLCKAYDSERESQRKTKAKPLNCSVIVNNIFLLDLQLITRTWVSSNQASQFPTLLVDDILLDHSVVVGESMAGLGGRLVMVPIT